MFSVDRYIEIGVHDLLKLIREVQGHEAGVRYDNLRHADLGDRRVGVDISVFMHKLIVREDIVKAFHWKPEICLQVYIDDDYFDRILRSLQGCNITPIFVFDGKKYPLKEETNQERLQNRQNAEREIDDLLQNPLEVDILPDLIKWMNNAVFVREDIVACSLDWAVRISGVYSC